MDVGQVKFSVTADNLQETLDKARELQSVLNDIDGNKIAAGAKSALKGTAKAAEDATEEVTKDTKKAENEIARLTHKRSEQRIKEHLATNKRVAKIDKQLRSAQKKADDEEIKQNVKRQNMKIKMRQETAKRVSGILKDQAKEEEKASKEAQAAAEKAAKAPTEFRKRWQTNLVNVGSQMQTLGNTLVRAASPFENVFRGLTMGIGYRLLGKVTQSIEGAFSRYDTISTYGKVLKNLGVDATKKFSIAGAEATDVYHNLENAVLGLPTGIDEIIASMRRYAGATGDVERATELAIAANNAYISGYMGEREKLFTERQLVALAGGAELSTNQWDSLRRNAPLAMRVVAKDMKMSVKDMIAALKEGTVSGQEFLDVFIKAGTEGKLKEAAQEMKQTWDAVSQNVQNRLNAMGEGILNTLDTVFKKMDGRTFLQHVLGVDKNGNYIGGGIRGVIDGLSKEVQSWIKANPDKITGFFNDISKINWSSIISGFAKFGLTMGRVFAYLGKFVNGNFIRFMLDLGLAGRALGIGGGVVKGTAGIMSWILTFAKFSGAGGALGKAVSNAEKLAKSREAITGATDAVAGAALSWQNVASKGLSIAAIPAMAWALKEVALGLQELGKVNLSWGLVGKIAVAGGAITAFAGLAAAMGTLTTGHAIGWITTASTAVGVAEMAGVSKTMKWIGEGLNSIAEAKIPSLSKLNRVIGTMNEVAKQFESKNPLEAFGKIFDSWEKSSEYKAIKNMGEAISSIDEALNVPIKTGWQDRAITRFGHLFDVVDFIEMKFDEQDAKLMQGSTRQQEFAKGSKAKKAQETYTYRKERMREFADYAKTLSDGLGDLSTAISNIYSFNETWAKLDKNSHGTVDWDVFEARIGGLINTFYRLASSENGESSPLQKLRQVAEQLKGGDYAKITEALGEIPRIIGKLAAIQTKITTSALFNNSGIHNLAERHNPLASLSTKLVPVFRSIASISSRIPKVGGLKRLNSISKQLEKIPTVINKLVSIQNDANIGNINTGALASIVSKIKEALAQFDELKESNVDINVKIKADIDDKATDKINDAYDDVNSAIKKFQNLRTPKTATVRLNLDAVITGKKEALRKIRDAIAEINAAMAGLNVSGSGSITGGYGAHGHPSQFHNGGKIRPLYRAHGGLVFNSRGTDTIPAMLTKGEYVINRMAASRIGDTALWRLNHMDIAGALRSLATKAGQGIVPHGNVVNNTTNNTKNIDVDIHNGSGGNIGLGRANRWVRSI